jgi:hypothetical protein
MLSITQFKGEGTSALYWKQSMKLKVESGRANLVHAAPPRNIKTHEDGVDARVQERGGEIRLQDERT